MDDGAHYFRSDFQVHTPRDINWKGHRAVTDDERRQPEVKPRGIS